MPATATDQWVYVAAPLFAYGLATLGLAAWGWGEGAASGNPVTGFFRAISWSLRRLTGLPGWSMAGALTGLTAAGIAAVGVYWDVAWHVDLGRDDELFTPSHTMILIGLNGMVFAAAIAVLFANLDRPGPGQGDRRLRVPWSALVLGALGVGASAAFPLDDLWHRAYGVDVTLWSPTHLQLISGGSLSPVAVWLMLREGRRELGAGGGGERPAPLDPGRFVQPSTPTGLGRAVEVLSFGAILTGLSIVQAEFDFGVPQFQVIYQPLLVAAAAGLGLVAARVALGPGGAALAVVGFLVLRGIFALLVGGALNHTVPRFPLYVTAALAVEAAAWLVGTRRRLRFAVAAGALSATAGVAAELAWVRASGWGLPTTNARPVVLLLSLVAGVTAAVLGAALVSGVPGGEPGRHRFAGGGGGGRPDGNRLAPARPAPTAQDRLRPQSVGAAGAVLALVLAIPLPRDVGAVEAVIGLDRLDGAAMVSVQLDPPAAAAEASVFGLVAWQGGGRVLAELDEIGPGRYVSTRPIPVSGEWKSMVALQRGDQVMAAPIYLPADPEIGASAVPAQAERRVAFARNTDVLLREAKDGPAWPALLSYTGVAVVLGLWLVLFARAASRVGPPTPARIGRRGRPLEPALSAEP